MKLNQSGSTLIQMMILGAVVVGGGVTLMKQQDNASQTQSRYRFHSDLENVNMRIRTALANPVSCSSTINPLNRSNNTIYNLRYVTDLSGTPSVLYSPGQQVGIGDFYLKELKLINSDPSVTPLTTTNGNILVAVFGAKSVIGTNNKNKKAKIGDIQSRFPLTILGEKTSGKYTECYSDPLGKISQAPNIACNNLGAGNGCKIKDGFPKCMLVTNKNQCPTNKGFKWQDGHSISLRRVSNYGRTCTRYYYGAIPAVYYHVKPQCTVVGENRRCAPETLAITDRDEGTECVDNFSFASSTYQQCCRVDYPPNEDPEPEDDIETTGCFVAGTQISMSNGEKKSIEDVLTGDRLMDVQKNPVVVKKLIAYPYKGDIYSINGGEYFFTPNHPFAVLSQDQGRVWKSLMPEVSMKESHISVSMMKVGDILIKENSLEVIYALDAIPYEGMVYNFTVSGGHEYLANDYAVHNAKEYDPMGGAGGGN